MPTTPSSPSWVGRVILKSSHEEVNDGRTNDFTIRGKTLELDQVVLLVLPLIILGVVILLFLTTGGGLDLTSPAPVEALTVERTVLHPARSRSPCATPAQKT